MEVKTGWRSAAPLWTQLILAHRMLVRVITVLGEGGSNSLARALTHSLAGTLANDRGRNT